MGARYTRKSRWTKVYERIAGPLYAIAVLAGLGVALMKWFLKAQ